MSDPGQLAYQGAQAQVAATLTSALVAAAGRQHSVDEVVALYFDVFFTLNPQPNSGRYQAWQQNKRTDQRHS